MVKAIGYRLIDYGLAIFLLIFPQKDKKMNKNVMRRKDPITLKEEQKPKEFSCQITECNYWLNEKEVAFEFRQIATV